VDGEGGGCVFLGCFFIREGGGKGAGGVGGEGGGGGGGGVSSVEEELLLRGLTGRIGRSRQ